MNTSDGANGLLGCDWSVCALCRGQGAVLLKCTRTDISPRYMYDKLTNGKTEVAFYQSFLGIISHLGIIN